MRKWFRNTDKIEVWIVDLASKHEDGGVEKYDVEYYQGFFKNFEISAPADDKVELTYEMAIDGNGVIDTDTLTETQKSAINKAQYEYHTLAKEAEATGVSV